MTYKPTVSGWTLNPTHSLTRCRRSWANIRYRRSDTVLAATYYLWAPWCSYVPGKLFQAVTGQTFVLIKTDVWPITGQGLTDDKTWKFDRTYSL